MRASLLTLMLALAGLAAQAAELKLEPVKPTPVAANPEAGKKLYARWCAQCHGLEGKGDGPAAEFVYPRPRDFTLALYKVRTTPSGQLPTDHDLFKAISVGLPGTSMPAWEKFIGEEDRWQLVHHLKTFDSLGLFKEEAPKQQLVVSGAPKVDDALIAHGKQVYQDKKCGKCHGQYGRGDGQSAPGMKDDWGYPIRPVNYTKPWIYRGGASLEDIYRTFTTGFNGTPMPSFADTIVEADRWALAAYVKSLTREISGGQVVKARYHEGELPAKPDDPAWNDAPRLDAQLAGQIVLEPRQFKPGNDMVSARALYNGKEVALLVTWDDGTNNLGTDGKPVDQVALQLPLEQDTGTEKPYFLLGDRAHPVDHWRWNAAQGLARQVFAGHDQATPRDTQGLTATGDYKDGQYRVVFRRALQGRSGELAFAPGAFVPIAFQAWDGEQGDEGLKMAMSSWYSLLLEPPTPFTVYLWPLGIGFIALGGEVWLLRRSRRKHQSPE
ncbi:MAG: c-type cytochrome [Pseudomonadota bacterium]|nr:c-type cytochrome [Pseudomonadota bacterium]MDP2352604.1 c-type cytochrome [Pseudomonadota bacterium]